MLTLQHAHKGIKKQSRMDTATKSFHPASKKTINMRKKIEPCLKRAWRIYI